MTTFSTNVLAISKMGYPYGQMISASKVCLAGDAFNIRRADADYAGGQIGHVTAFRASYNGSPEDFAKRFASTYQARVLMEEFKTAFENPLAIVNSEYLHQLPTGEYTELSDQLIKAMGPAIALPLSPTISWNSSFKRYSRQESRFAALYNSKAWIDTRGTLSHIGPKWRNYIVRKGARMALTTQDYFDFQRTGLSNGYSLNKVSGATAAKAGNYFLYKQQMDLWVPETSSFKSVTWIGLATCTTVQTVARFAWKSTPSLAFNACTRFGTAKFSIKDLPSKDKMITPFDRYCNQPRPVIWTAADWARHSSLTEDNYRSKPSTDLLEVINSNEALTVSPIALLIKRLEEQDLAKSLELLENSNKIQDQRKSLAWTSSRLEKLHAQIADLNSKASLHQRELNNAQKTILELAPVVASQEMISTKIKEAIAKKKAMFELQKQSYLTTIQDQKNSGVFKGFSEGLAKSGMVLVDIEYTSSYNITKSGSRHPEVVDDPAWEMTAVRLETNRPIPMTFGLDEIAEAPRMSGPHKIKCGIRNGEVYARIGALYAWSVVGLDRKGTSFKPYPHCPWQDLDTETPGAYIRSLTKTVEICMGELAAVIAVAFRNQSAKQVALAVLSFLQSVDPNDEWGRSYVHFPFAREQKNLVPKPFSDSHGDTVRKDYHWYYTFNDSRYMYFDEEASQIFWGDCKVQDGMITELTVTQASTRGTAIEGAWYFLNEFLDGDWVHQKLGYRARNHQGAPTWEWNANHSAELTAEPAPEPAPEHQSQVTGYTPVSNFT